jgi:hypothetical protein
MVETDKVVFAEKEMTVHVLLGKPTNTKKKQATESRLLLPGQTIELDRLPWYLKEKIESNEVDGLSLLEAEEVERRLAERDRFLGLTSQATGSVANEAVS